MTMLQERNATIAARNAARVSMRDKLLPLLSWPAGEGIYYFADTWQVSANFVFFTGGAIHSQYSSSFRLEENPAAWRSAAWSVNRQDEFFGMTRRGEKSIRALLDRNLRERVSVFVETARRA